MPDNCIFCKIALGTIPAQPVYEDEQVMAFRDLHSQAPVHVLLIPKRHIASLDELNEGDRPLAGHLLERVGHVARLLGVAQAGYRTIINTNADGGQEVFHLHIHLLGGRRIGPMTVR